ncbi:uncharacterized protein [Magallana gigas]|uniref:uncharacterized protein isoform X2 n=1 Tax=Magallana gigas TaxID=29159 RepID=UPI00333FF107
MESSIEIAKEYWNIKSSLAAQKNRETRHQHGRGPCNIFILDTSSSLREQGFAQMKNAFTSIIDEYANHPDIDENVAVIICGRQTKFLSYYSNHYGELKRALDNVEFGGPSPLTAAFLLSKESLKRDVSHSYQMGEFHIHPRILLISDGKPTYFSESINHDCSENGTLQTLLEFISAQSRGGKMIHSQESRQFALYSRNIMIASKLTFSFENDGNDRERVLTALVCSFPDKVFTEMDQTDIFEICSKVTLYKSLDEISSEQNDAYEERDPKMPSLGSRVIRGRDWKYSNQDNFGTGTVIGHSKEDGWLNVEWDTGSVRMYRYGSTNTEKDKFDVQVCDNPRILQNELIATGCLVTRGPDWLWNNQDGGTGNIGSVLTVRSDGTVLVQWECGNRRPMGYRFGCDGRFELQICDPFSAQAAKYFKNQMRKAGMNSPDEAVDCANKECNNVSGSPVENNVDTTKRPILHISKGKYFRNDTVNDSCADADTDGPTFHHAVNQWLWKDGKEGWIPYSTEMNDRINKSYTRDPNSTVVVTVKDQLCRVLIAKSKQINLATREISEVKLVENDTTV